MLDKIEQILINSTQLILNSGFKTIGFDKINDEILKHLVVSRICQPQSKLATVDYLKSYFDENVELHKIYRYLDKLNDTQKESIQKISVEHTRKVLGGKIGVVFYDVCITRKDPKNSINNKIVKEAILKKIMLIFD